MVRAAKMATLATVVAVADGPRLFSGAPDDLGVPTQRITFESNGAFYERVPARFVLFKTGSQSLWGDGDPPYAVGERYLMFASRRPEDPGTFLNVVPDGRFRVRTGGFLESLVHGPVANALAGLTTGEARQIVTRVRRSIRSR